jgi:hypothetical protein
VGTAQLQLWPSLLPCPICEGKGWRFAPALMCDRCRRQCYRADDCRDCERAERRMRCDCCGGEGIVTPRHLECYRAEEAALVESLRNPDPLGLYWPQYQEELNRQGARV